MANNANTTALANLIACERAEFPYILSYTRRGGPDTAVGLSVGSQAARSREDAEAIQGRMEITDAAHGHVTTYDIWLRYQSTSS